MFNKETVAKNLGEIIGTTCCWLIETGFIYWGYLTLAPHLNAPEFTYMEIFSIRMGLAYLLKVIRGNRK